MVRSAGITSYETARARRIRVARSARKHRRKRRKNYDSVGAATCEESSLADRGFSSKTRERGWMYEERRGEERVERVSRLDGTRGPRGNSIGSDRENERLVTARLIYVSRTNKLPLLITCRQIDRSTRVSLSQSDNALMLRVTGR